MIRKESDGKYYEKIITWEKRKCDNITITLAFLFLGGLIGFVMGWIVGASNGSNFLGSFLFILGFSIFFFVLNFFESHKKIVKYRRIGS